MIKLNDLEVLLIEQNDITGNANVVCQSSSHISNQTAVATFVADCDQKDLESTLVIQCDCCTTCCRKSETDCNEDPEKPVFWLDAYDAPQYYNGRNEKYSPYPTMYDDSDF